MSWASKRGGGKTGTLPSEEERVLREIIHDIFDEFVESEHFGAWLKERVEVQTLRTTTSQMFLGALQLHKIRNDADEIRDMAKAMRDMANGLDEVLDGLKGGK